MLKNIDPLLSPELLKVPCEMGHGDDFVAQPVAYMQVGGTASGDRSALPREGIADMAACGAALAGPCEATERFTFCERVGRAFAIVQTGEMQAWANVIFKKGVIAEALRA